MGYFGSYARGDWGVGSDLDVVVLLSKTEEPSGKRGLRWNMMRIPVPVDLLIYTEDVWRTMRQSGQFVATVEREAVWVFER